MHCVPKLVKIFIAILFGIAKGQKRPRYLLTVKCYILIKSCNGIQHSNENEFATLKNIDNTHKYDTEQQKPDTKSYYRILFI